MTRFLLVLCIISCLLACKPGVPSDIVQPEEMEKILLDIHVVDGFVSSIPAPDSARKVSAPIYKGIFKKYGIDSAMHSRSMAYYYRHPDLLSKMYNNISARLTKSRDAETKRIENEAKLAAKKEKQRQQAIKAKLADSIKADSIKKAVKAKKVDTVKKSSLAKPRKPLNIFKKAQAAKN